MNISCNPPHQVRLGTPHKIAYELGHRDARHSAAKLANEADATIRELVEILQSAIDVGYAENGWQKRGSNAITKATGKEAL